MYRVIDIDDRSVEIFTDKEVENIVEKENLKLVILNKIKDEITCYLLNKSQYYRYIKEQKKKNEISQVVKSLKIGQNIQFKDLYIKINQMQKYFDKYKDFKLKFIFHNKINKDRHKEIIDNIKLHLNPLEYRYMEEGMNIVINKIKLKK